MGQVTTFIARELSGLSGQLTAKLWTRPQSKQPEGILSGTGMNRKASPPHQTTVLSRVKGSRASHAGFAALDKVSAPWWNKLWTMDEGALRTKEVALDKNKSQTCEKQPAQSRLSGQGIGGSVGESAQFTILRDSYKGEHSTIARGSCATKICPA